MRAVVVVHECAPSRQAGARRGLSAIGACGRFADDEEAFSTDGRERLENSKQMRRLGASGMEAENGNSVAILETGVISPIACRASIGGLGVAHGGTGTIEPANNSEAIAEEPTKSP
jgi:hypothetical protein